MWYCNRCETDSMLLKRRCDGRCACHQVRAILWYCMHCYERFESQTQENRPTPHDITLNPTQLASPSAKSDVATDAVQNPKWPSYPILIEV